MPFLVFDSTRPQKSEIQRLKQDLIASLNTALSIQRQMDEMTDDQLRDQFGVPLGSETGFRTNIDNAVVALTSAAITNIISSVGFTQ